MKKIFLDSIGCRLNQSEVEHYAQQLRAAGHEIVTNAELADLAIINTCAVTSAAASDSRQKIRRAARAGAGEVIVTGCWSTLDPKAAARLPAVTQVVSNLEKDGLALTVLANHPGVNSVDRPQTELMQPRTEDMHTRAFIKVQDGCDNRCTFCVTTLARGEGRSRLIEEVIADVQATVAAGAQEVVLTGVHLGSWGYEFSKPSHLRFLLTAILNETDVPRVRLSSLEPWDLDEEFFSLWAESGGRLCRHLHLPLQSGSAATLRRMARKTSPDSFQSLVAAARHAIPGLAVTTDVIVGFPGETTAEFTESLTFVKEMAFAGGHIFPYSPRPGTAASRMPNQVARAKMRERSQLMHEAVEQSAAAFRRGFLGKELKVLWEGGAVADPETQQWQLNGLTDNYLRVQTSTPRRLWNVITPVKLEAVITSYGGEVLRGRLVM